MTALLKKYAIFTILANILISPPVLADALLDKGKKIAAEHCTRCHVVGDINPNGGISSTPSFQLMVNELSDWKIRFETFHTRRPHPAIIRFKGYDYSGDTPTTVPIILELEDVNAILAFAKTLKKQ